jgi:hypothetical protein
MNSMLQINDASAKTPAESGFRRAMFAGIDGMRPGYMAQTPHTQAVRHVLPPSILENKAPLPSQHRSGRPSSADAWDRMDGGFPECAADMKSTLRWAS